MMDFSGIDMEYFEPKIMLMTDGPRYVCSRCGVKYKKGLISTATLSTELITFFLLQYQRYDLMRENAVLEPSVPSVRKLSLKNAILPNTWKNINAMDCGSMQASIL